MRQQHLLAPAIVAALAALGASPLHAATGGYGSWQRAVAEPAQPMARAQVAQELAQARAANWQGYGSEVTLDPQPAPTGVMTRDEVLAEYRDWQAAGALAEDSEAGPSQATLDRRVALNNRQVERYARAIEAEQQRLAQAEAARRAAEQQQMATPQPGTTPGASAGTAPSPATGSGTTSATLSSGTMPAAQRPQPQAPQPQAPAAPSKDAIVDTTRQQAPPEQAQPSPVR
jgi:hypothetical protein